MKIAFITQPYPPMISGVSIVVERLAEGMAERGHQILVIAASEIGHAYTAEANNLKVVRLKSVPNPKRACQRYVRGSFKPIYTDLKAFQPDLIHIHDVLTLGIVGALSARQLHIPVVTTIHQLPWFVCAYLPDAPGVKPLVTQCLWKYSRWLNRQCETMIVPTKTISRTVASHGGFRTVAISNGVDLQHFIPGVDCPEKDQRLFEKYHLDPELPIILHVGRLDIDKSVDLVIRAAALAMRRTPAQLLVVGDGECWASLMRLSKQLGVLERCHFPGFVDPATDLPVLYRMASVFTTASEIETQGLVLLEAMACGLPIVAVDATCVHEVVQDDKNGYLLSPGDWGGLARRLAELLRNPIRARQMGQKGRFMVVAHSVCNSLDQHEKLYRKVVRRYQWAGRSLFSRWRKIPAGEKIKPPG